MKASYLKPLLPLRDIVIFPSMVVPLFVGREKSIKALQEVMKSDKSIVLVTQKNSEIDDPKKTDVFMYGCEGSILQLLKLPDGTVKVLVEGIKRVKILDFKDNEKFITCEFTHYNDISIKDEDLYPLAATALRRLEKLTSINKKISNETINSIKQLKDPSQIADNIASHITATISEKQQIFETIDVKKRLNAIIKIMENETSIIGVEKRIRGRVKTQMEKTQREYYLNEQLKAIQKELGNDEDGKDEFQEIKEKISKVKLPKDALEKVNSEFKKLKNMSPMSAESGVVRSYIDWILSLPWKKLSKINKKSFKIVLYDILNKPVFESVKEFDSKADALVEIQKFINFFDEHKRNKTDLKEFSSINIDIGNSHEFPVDFDYSNSLSIILPNWPFRFQNNEFLDHLKYILDHLQGIGSD